MPRRPRRLDHVKHAAVWLLALLAIFWVACTDRHTLQEKVSILAVPGGFALWFLDRIVFGYLEIRKLRKAVFSDQIDAERALAFSLSGQEGLFWLRLCAERGDMDAIHRLSAALEGLYFKTSLVAAAHEAIFWALLQRRLIVQRNLGSQFHIQADGFLNGGFLNSLKDVVSQDELSCLESYVEAAIKPNKTRFVRPAYLRWPDLGVEMNRPLEKQISSEQKAEATMRARELFERLPKK